MAFDVPPETLVSDVMTVPLVTIPADEHLYRAVARMRKNTLRAALRTIENLAARARSELTGTTL